MRLLRYLVDDVRTTSPALAFLYGVDTGLLIVVLARRRRRA